MHYTTSCNTQSSAPEDGRNNCLKLVELIVIINKTVIVASSWLSILFKSKSIVYLHIVLNSVLKNCMFATIQSMLYDLANVDFITRIGNI